MSMYADPIDSKIWYLHADNMHVDQFYSIDEVLEAAKVELLNGKQIIIQTRQQWLDMTDEDFEE